MLNRYDKKDKSPIDFSWQIRKSAFVPNQLLSKLEPVLAENAALDGKATGAAISEVRRKLNIAQKTLAIEMGISQSFLCDLEQGKRDWWMDTFDKAKAALERLSK